MPRISAAVGGGNGDDGENQDDFKNRLAAMLSRGPPSKSAMAVKRPVYASGESCEDIVNAKMDIPKMQRNRVQTTKKYDASNYDFDGF